MELQQWFARLTGTARQVWHRLQGVFATGQDSENPPSGEINPDNTLAFFRVLLKAQAEGRKTAVYRELDKQGGQLDPQLPEAAKIFLEQSIASDPETQDVGLIEKLANSLRDYPRGHRPINVTVAIALYQLVLTALPRNTVPDKWAIVQNCLGNAYCQLPTGDRTANLKRAIACYEAALTVRKPDTAPDDWAKTQNGLGNAYLKLPTGDRVANLKQAIACFEAALTVCTPDTAAYDWATTQNNLGNAYSDLPTGERVANVQRAIAYYEAALTVRTTDTAPYEWATTQNNLGNAYSDLPTGERTANLQKAIACYQAAFTVWTLDTAPYQWAITQNNLGLAYSDLLTGDRAANVQRAIQCHEAALTVWTTDTAPYEWATAQNNLGCAYKNLPTGDRGANVQRAIQCHEAALTVRKPDTAPYQWAISQNNLGLAYYTLPTGDRVTNLQRAIARFKAALTVWTPDTASNDWEIAQKNLDHAYKNLPTGDRVGSKETILSYQAALTVNKLDTAPYDWAMAAMAQKNLSLADFKLPTEDRTANLKEAIECYQAVVSKPELLPWDCFQKASHWANLEFNRGHWQEALTHYQLALEAIEESRRWALSEKRRKQIVQKSIYIYEKAIQAAINFNNISAALEIVELVRAKHLVDLFATADLYQNKDIPDEVRQYLQQLDHLDDKIYQKRKKLAQKQKKLDDKWNKPESMKTRQFRAATHVAADIARLEEQKQEILDKLSIRDEVVAKLRQLQPPKLADFIPLLQDSPGSAILSFYTTRYDTHIFILRYGETVPNCFTCKGQGYETLQQWLRKMWVNPYSGFGITEKDKKKREKKLKQRKKQWERRMPKLLAALSRRLEIERLIEEKLQGLDELILIPYLFLHQIPFAALPVSVTPQTGADTENGAGTGALPLLGDKFLLRYAPSVQVLGFCHNRHPVTAQKYGTVENATNDLPCSGFEGANVARLFDIKPEQRLIGANATRKGYRQLLENTTHLLSTHHAQSRFDNPLESGLRLSDGNITVSQLLSPGWRFKELDEVFLSCCETGLFLPKGAIDEPVALSTGFLCAGARGVIASQWSIYDLSAALLSILYHEQRQSGKNRPVALHAAQQKMRQMTGAEFEENYKEPLQKHLKAEKARILETKKEQIKQSEQKEEQEKEQMTENLDDYYSKLITAVTDSQKSIKRYAADKGCPFEHPVHWASLGCYGLR